MGLDIITLAAAKNYTNLAALGLSSVTVDDTNKTITFTLTSDGSQHTVQFDQPSDGISVEGLNIDENNHLICILSDGSEIDAGEFPSNKPVLEQRLTPNIFMGSVKNNYPVGTSLEEIIRDILTEKNPPALAVNLNPSTQLYNAVSDVIDYLKINAVVTKKTNDIAKIEYYINNTLVNTVSEGCSSGGTFPYSYNTPINDNTVIKVVATDIEGLSSTISKKIEFYPPIYYGIINANISEPTEVMIKTLNSKLQNTKVFTYSGITTDWGKVCVCIPKVLGTISSIFDTVNNLSYNSSFSTITVNVDGFDYSVLTQIDPSAANGVTLKFS